jgi:hypothetical protein
LPWLDYTGQTTEELIASKDTHSIESLLCAFASGIGGKHGPQGDGRITSEEELVLAVMALDREVNNGGYDQFFVNPSRKFAPIIVDCLRRIDCFATVAITERAIATLRLPEVTVEAIAATIYTEDADRDEMLDACNQEFYRLTEITPRLFEFVEAHQDRIQLVKVSVPPRPARRKLDNASKLYISLGCSKNTDHSLDGARRLARELALQDSIPANDAEIEGAAVLYTLRCSLAAGDLDACETLAPRAFELMREGTAHVVVHHRWVEQLIDGSKHESADAATFAYLEYLRSCDQSTLGTQNNILYWAALLQEHRTVLSRSVEFFVANFPDEDLDQRLPAQRFTAKERKPKQE